MTPPATAAARTARRAISPSAVPARPTHRTAPSPRRAAVRHPRRISGPARSAPTATAAAAVALPAPGIALPGQRPLRPVAPGRSRPTRPARPARPTRPARSPARRTTDGPGLVLRAAGALDRVSESALLDRLVRGRAWIGLLAFALIGIVAMQLLVLKLNTGIGHTLQRETLLQRQISQIGIEDSVSSAGDRIEPLAAAAGMSIAAPSTLHFVQAGPSDLGQAATALGTAVQAPTTSGVSGGAETPAGSTAALGTGARAPVGGSTNTGSSAGAGSSAPGTETSPPESASSSASSSAASGSPGEGSAASASVSGAASAQSAPAEGVQASPQG